MVVIQAQQPQPTIGISLGINLSRMRYWRKTAFIIKDGKMHMIIVSAIFSNITTAAFSRAFVIGVALLALASTTACAKFAEQLTRPKPFGLAETPPGTPEFRQGWEDGCETGMGTYGNNRYKAAYGFIQDPVLVNNPEYYRAWQDGQLYCRWYTFGWVTEWEG